MHGSNECTVRRISIGCSGSATGVPISASSYGPAASLRVARAGVPRARHDALVVGDRAVVDVHPVAERAARRLVEARRPIASAGHVRGLPLRVVVDAQLAGRPCSRPARRPSRPSSRRAPASRCRAPRRGRASRTAPRGRRSSCLQHGADQLLHARVPGHVRDEHARQRTDLHRLVVVARRLQPRVLLSSVSSRSYGGVGPGVVRRGLALETDAAPSSSPPLVLVPGVRDVLGDLRRDRTARPSTGRGRG